MDPFAQDYTRSLFISKKFQTLSTFFDMSNRSVIVTPQNLSEFLELGKRWNRMKRLISSHEDNALNNSELTEFESLYETLYLNRNQTADTAVPTAPPRNTVEDGKGDEKLHCP